MPINIILSDNLRACTNKLIQNLCSDELVNNEHHILVVPDRFTLVAEKKVMSTLCKTAVFNIEVLTVSRLCNAVLNDSTQKYLTDSGALMLVRKIILSHVSELKCFKKAVHNVGFAQSLFENMVALMRSDISALDLLNVINNTSDTALKLKLEDIYLIYADYEKELEQKYSDHSAKFNAFINAVSNSTIINQSHIYMAEFDSFAPQDYRLIENLMKYAKSFSITCFDEQKNNKDTINSNVFNNIYRLANKLEQSVGIQKFNSLLNTPFKHLSNNLYAYPFKKFDLVYGAINIYEANDILDEVTYMARNIRDFIVNQGIRYKDVAILTGAFNKYDKIIKEVFKKFDIPYFLDNQENLANHELSRFLLSVLDIIKNDLKYSDVMTFVKNYFFGLTTEEQDYFENYCLEYGIDHNKFFDLFKLGVKNSGFNIAENVRKRFINCIKPLYVQFKTEFNAMDFVTVLNQFMTDCNVPDKINALCNIYNTSHNITEQKTTEQVLQKLQIIFTELAEILGTTTISLDEVYAIFNMGLNSSKISLIPVAIDSVFVGDISISMPEECAYIFVAGCNLNQVPLLKEDCGIINDNELQHITKLEPSVKYVNSRQRFKIHQILCLPQKKLFVSYSNLLENGEKAKPSLLIKGIKKLFTYKGKDLPISNYDKEIMHSIDIDENSEAKQYATYFSSKNVALDELSRAMRAYKNFQDYPSLKAYTALYYLLAQKPNSLKQIEHNLNYQNQTTNIEKARDLLFKKQYTKVSQIETFFECPFKHFMDYGLKLKKRMISGINAVDAGNLLHKTAEIFVSTTKGEYIDNIKCKTLSQNIINAILSREEYITLINDDKNRGIITSLKEEAVRLCSAINYQNANSAFKVIATEKKFTTNALTSGNLQIKLVGVIDRVDKYNDYVRVIDYKTGKCDIKYSEIYYGLKLQLLVYLYVLIKEFGYKPAGAYYLPIHNEFNDYKSTSPYEIYKLMGISEDNIEILCAMDKRVDFDHPKSDIAPFSIKTSTDNRNNNVYELSRKSNFIVTKERIEILLGYTEKLMLLALEKINSGYIDCSPYEQGDHTACEHCDYLGVCKFDTLAGNKTRVLKSVRDFDTEGNADGND
ncbi:MAG: PD-(D/E)XK nuclease family protein [Clostridia bacterium]|jgi:ATP-dependent helicase/nuclease subunit B|nr:PD-(D/E)XK nuclease family protein [Clostridia bacterium]